MNTRKLQAAALIAASLVAGSAFAAGSGYGSYDYPETTASSTLSRAAVRAEAVAAARNGTSVNDEYQAHQFPKAEVFTASGLLREQVVAEAVEARRLGLIAEGDGTMPVPTAAQLEQVRLAG
ncbi:MAG: DUF4148 domain-containing protein, partial [Rubrivivax sp.]